MKTHAYASLCSYVNDYFSRIDFSRIEFFLEQSFWITCYTHLSFDRCHPQLSWFAVPLPGQPGVHSFQQLCRQLALFPIKIIKVVLIFSRTLPVITAPLFKALRWQLNTVPTEMLLASFTLTFTHRPGIASLVSDAKNDSGHFSGSSEYCPLASQSVWFLCVLTSILCPKQPVSHWSLLCKVALLGTCPDVLLSPAPCPFLPSSVHTKLRTIPGWRRQHFFSCLYSFLRSVLWCTLDCISKAFLWWLFHICIFCPDLQTTSSCTKSNILLLFLFFETGSSNVAQVGFELWSSCLSSPSAGITVTHHT
jgi:hypothetical protein